MKQCSKCGLEKEESEFYGSKITRDKLYYSCKICCRKYMREYEKSEERRVYHEVRAKSLERREYLKEYEKSEKRLEYVDKYEKSSERKLASSLRKRLHSALKGNFKTGSAVRDLGCTIVELKQHLEKQFQLGMTWENYGKWHIDHKYPLSRVDLTDKKQLLRVCRYTNLQPLWAKENMSKGDKVLDF